MEKYVISMAVKAHGFPRAPEDDRLANDFMSGFALADHIKTRLSEIGYTTFDLIPEDFGWWLDIVQPGTGFRASVVFSSCAEDENDRHMIPEIRVGIDPSKPFRRKWLCLKEDISSQILRLSADVFGILRSTEGVETGDTEEQSIQQQ